MNRLFYLGQAGDDRFLEERRKFIRNTGMLLGLMGVAPGVRFETTQKLLKAVGLNSLYAQSALPLFPAHLIEVCFRTGFNFRSVMPPALAATNKNKQMAVWCGNTDDVVAGNNAYAYGSYGVTQSATTGNWLPSLNNQIVHAASVPMAHYRYSINTETHGTNFNLRAGMMNTTSADAPTARPNFSDLHSGLTPHHAIFAPSVRLKINAGGAVPTIIHNSNPTFDANFSPLKFGPNNQGTLANSLGKNSSSLISLLQNQVLELKQSMASLQSTQINPLMSEITRLAQSRLTRLQVQNATSILKSPEKLKTVFASEVSALLSLSSDEQGVFGSTEAFDIFCPTLTYTTDSNRYGKYNLGFWLGTLAKAFEFGLLQRAVIEVEVTDHHADSTDATGSNLSNGGWQRDQMRTGLGILQAIAGWHTYTKSRTSLTSDQSLFDDSMILLSSDLGRRPNTRTEDEETPAGNGAYTDTGDGSAILVGSERLIHSGTFYNHTNNHLETRYPANTSDGAQAKQVGNQTSPTTANGQQAWEMTARAIVGDDRLKQYLGQTHTFGPYSFLLKR